MTAEPGRPARADGSPAQATGSPSPGGWPDHGKTVERARPRPPAAFRAEIRAALRYERGLAVKAAVVLAALAVLFVLRALYFALAGGAGGSQRRHRGRTR